MPRNRIRTEIWLLGVVVASLLAPEIRGHTVSTLAGAPFLQDQQNELQNLKDLYQNLPAPSANYSGAYGHLKRMQAVSDREDREFIRSYSSSLDASIVNENVAVHVLMAVSGALLLYEDLYDRHMAVAFDRIRRRSGFEGEALQDELGRILALQMVGQTRLDALYCRVANARFCASRTGGPSSSRSHFQALRESGINPVRLVFDRSPNMNNLGEFRVRAVDHLASSQLSVLFAAALDHQLKDPIVSNWFFRYFQKTSPDRIDGPETIFAGEIPVHIGPSDYFVIDPADQQKIAWRNQLQGIFQLKRRIPLSLRIPDGDYYFYPRRVPVPENLRPNLKIDGKGDLDNRQFEVYMDQSRNSVIVDAVEEIPSEPVWARVFKPDFQLLAFRFGTDVRSSRLDGALKFRLFHRFNRYFALQTQFEGVFQHHHDTNDLEDLLPEFVERDEREPGSFSSREFQVDIGPILRFDRFQIAAMESLRVVDRNGWDNAGTVGHFFFNFNYLFRRGQIGGYYTHANQDEGVVRTVQIDTSLFEETYLKVANQVGVNFNLQLTNRLSAEGTFGYVDSALRDSVPGGTIRFNLPPIARKLKLTAEVGVNESFVSREDNWRFGFGVRFGEWGRANSPARFLDDSRPVPVFVPRVRYETLTRLVRRGNRAPVADAGPDMPDLVPFTRVVLDGTGSSDPDGDSLTFAWSKLADCPSTVVLEGADEAVASLVIGNGESCTVQLVVTDSVGLASEPDTKLISSLFVQQPVLIEFGAAPAEIRPGESSTLSWRTENADTVMITNVLSSEDLPTSGSIDVTPLETTTFTLTACNAVDECVSGDTTITVAADPAVIVVFTADPAEIRVGQSSTLSWETRNASEVSITNLAEDLPLSGTIEVAPLETTTYTLMACNDVNTCTTSDITVLVRPRLPVVLSFTATPSSVRIGQNTSAIACPDDEAGSLLEWATENAVTLTLTNVAGTPEGVLPQGSREVCLRQTTEFVLTASNDRAEIVSAGVTVEVAPRLPIIVIFSADLSEIRRGESTFLRWDTEFADTVQLTNEGSTPEAVAPDGVLGVMPSETTTYTLTAANSKGEIVSAAVTVLVRGAFPTIVSFSANPPELRLRGDEPEAVELLWETNGATRVLISNLTNGAPPVSVPASGSRTVLIAETTTFTLSATNDRGEFASSDTTVVVRPPFPTIISFTVTADVIDPGRSTILRWETNGDAHQSMRVSITNIEDGAELPARGFRIVTLQRTTAFTLTVRNGAGKSATADVTVTVIQVPGGP